MNTTRPPHTHRRHAPECLSHGTLELTFRLLRHQYPTLALEVRNLILNTLQHRNDHPEQPVKQCSNQATTVYLYVNLAASIVGQVVAALTELGQTELHNDGNRANGRRIVIKSLLEEWANVAEWVLSQAEVHTANSTIQH